MDLFNADIGTEITKTEEIDIQDHFIKDEIPSDENIQIKTETVNDNIDINNEIDGDTNNSILSTELDGNLIISSVGTSKEDAVLPDIDNSADIKEEVQDHSLLSYDFPNLDDGDAGSYDSSEATALGNVEACLQDDSGVKLEMENDYNDTDYDKIKVKEENDLTVTETHLISNKVINTTSTITSPHDGIVRSQTTKTLVMEILPMSYQADMSISKIGAPEEILPTTESSYSDMFQLNSITGNFLSLEQEAYGLEPTKSVKLIKEKKFHCPKCVKSYSSNYSLIKHLNVHQTIDNYKTGVYKGLQTKLKKKLLQQEKEWEEIEDIPVIERKRRKEEEQVKLEKDIKEVKKEEYQCTCGKGFRRRSLLETCLRSHNLDCDTKFVCITCRRQFQKKCELDFHRKRFHRKKFACKFCPTDYHSQKELFKHLQIHQKLQLMEYKVISQVMKGKQDLQCVLCLKSFEKLPELKSHVMKDHDKYVCPHCSKESSKFTEFSKHMKSSHPEVKHTYVLDALEAFCRLVRDWKCEDCDIQFYEADKLAVHQVEAHSPDLNAEYKHHCPECNRVFVSQKGMTSHRRVHDSTDIAEIPEVIEGVMCLECRKMCKDMTALTSHMRLHSMDRKYPCKYCDYRFATPEKRKTHSEIHTGDMKYVCFICEYQCSSENRLKAHKMNIKHANMKQYLLTGEPLITEPSTSEKSKEKKKVKKKKKEKRREDDRSSSESPTPGKSLESECDICGDKFPSESEMLEHKQTHPFIEFPNEDTPSRIFFK